MRVLIVGPDRMDPGGVANYYNAVFPYIKDDKVEPEYIQIGSTHAKFGGLYIIFDQLRFWRIVRKFKPHLIHLNPSLNLKSFLRDGIFIFLAKLQKKPVLVFFRGWDESFENTVFGWLKWFFNITYGRADAFVVLASKFKDLLENWGVTTPIYLGTTTVDNEMLKAFSIEDKVKNIIDSRNIRLLYLARLERAKGVLELIEAVRKLMVDGKAIELTIAGDGPIMGEVEQAVENFGEFCNKISIVGYVRSDKKIDILNTHHVYCFPTQYGEGMPNSVLEAMAFGMPIVTCPVGGLADFFEDGRMGTLINNRNPVFIEKAITSIISNREQLIEIARYNHGYALSRFLATFSAKMLKDCYHQIVRGA